MKQTFLISLICLVAASGCQKNSDDAPPSATTKYLQRYVTTTDGQSATYILQYDSKNRLTRYHSEEDDYHSKITYDNQGNPTTFELESGGSKQVFHITYSNTGVPISAVSTLTDLENPGEALETEITYEIANGKVSKMHFTDESGNEASYALSYVGNNLTRVTMTGDNGELELTWKYGNKKSAFSAARFEYLVIPDLFAVFSSENEMTESKLEITGLGSFTTTYTYQFDATGYPTGATEKDEEGNESKITYYYK